MGKGILVRPQSRCVQLHGYLHLPGVRVHMVHTHAHSHLHNIAHMLTLTQQTQTCTITMNMHAFTRTCTLTPAQLQHVCTRIEQTHSAIHNDNTRALSDMHNLACVHAFTHTYIHTTRPIYRGVTPGLSLSTSLGSSKHSLCWRLSEKPVCAPVPRGHGQPSGGPHLTASFCGA